MISGNGTSDNPQKDRADVDLLLAELEIVHFVEPAFRLFAQLRAEQQRSGRMLGDMDTLIAATSLANGHALLVTRNPSHFAGIGALTVESY